MKRLLSIFLSLLLLFTTVFVADNRVYAEEESSQNDETVEVLNEDSEEELPSEMNFEEETDESESSANKTEEEESHVQEEEVSSDDIDQVIDGPISEIQEYDPDDPDDPKTNTTAEVLTSGDVRIASENPVWLSELYEASQTGEWCYVQFSTGDQIGFYQLSSDAFERNGEGELTGFIISKDILLSNHVASGLNSVFIGRTPSYNGFRIQDENGDIYLDLDACLEVPSGLEVKETDEGLIFYFEDINDEKKDYLRSVVSFNDVNNRTGKSIRQGGYIYIGSNDDSQWADFRNNRYYEPDGTLVHTSQKVFLSEDETYVYIPTDVLLDENRLYRNSDVEYYANLEAYGYSYSDKVEWVGLNQACIKLDDDFSIRVSFDNEGALIIRPANYDKEEYRNWVAAACKFRVYTDNGVDLEKGSQLYIVEKSDEGYSTVNFYNQRHAKNEYSFQQHYELRTDEQGYEYIYISHSSLIDRFTNCENLGRKDSQFYVEFDTYGYSYYNSSQDEIYFSFPEDLIKKAPHLMVESVEGNLIINIDVDDPECSSYFDTLINSNESRIYLINENSYSSTCIFDEYSISRGKAFVSGDHQITITRDNLIDCGVMNGEKSVRIMLPGYVLNDSDSFELRDVCENPPTVHVEFDSDQNLLLVGDDPAWANSVFDGYSYLSILQDYYSSGYHVELSGKGVSVLDNAIVVSGELLSEAGIQDGTYFLEIRVYGYGSVTVNDVHLAGYRKELSAPISVKTDSSGNLVIACDDGDFLDGLMKPDHYIYSAEGYTYENGGYIIISYQGDNDSYHFNNFEEDYYGEKYSSYRYYRSGNKITIKNQDLLNQYVYNSDSAIIRLKAVGYPEQEIRNVKISGTGSANVPADINVRIDDNGDIKITSSNTEWLKALCTKSDYSASLQKNGGEIRFRMRDAGGYYYTYSSLSNSIYNTYYSLSGNTITISRDALIGAQIENGVYQLRLNAYKYKYVDAAEITVTKGLQEVPEGIEYRLTENGDLVIYSSNEGNEEYLKGIAKPYEYDKDGKRVSVGGHVEFVTEEGRVSIKENYISPNNTITNIIYDEVNHWIVIPREYLFNLSGSYRFYVYSYGYKNLCFETIDLPLITVYNPSVVLSSHYQFAINTDKHVLWSVDDESLATVDDNGLLTALGIGQIHLSAQIEGNEFVDTIPVSIIPPGNVSFSVTPTSKEVAVGDTVQIVPKYDTSLGLTVTYSSSDESLATVDENGLVTFLDAGKVTITSTLYEGKSATSVFTIYPVAKGTKLTASVEGYVSTGMEVLDSAQMVVKAGGETIEPEELTYTSASEAIAAVDENGLITAKKAGTAKITAKLKDDPSKRSVTFSVKVIARQIKELNLSLEDAAVDQVYDENGTLNLYFSTADIKKTYNLTVRGADKLGNAVLLKDVSATATYASVDSSVASVDKNGVLSIKKAGQTAIKATVSSNLKGSDPVTDTIIVRIINCAPVLESAKITVNKYFDEGTFVQMHPVQGTTIKKVELLKKTGEPESDFIIEHVAGEDHFIVKPTASLKNGKAKSYGDILKVTLTDDSSYEYNYTVAVTSVLPKVTFKASGLYYSALDASTLKLDIVTEEAIREVRFVNDWASMDESGNVTLNSRDSKGNYILKGTVEVYFDRYSGDAAFVKSTVTFKSDKNLPSASLHCEMEEALVKNAIILNRSFAPSIDVDLLSSNEDFAITDAAFKEDYSEKGLTASFNSGSIKVTSSADTPEGSYKYTITPYITVNGIDKALKVVTLTVKVSSALPKASLSTTKITLNNKCHETVNASVKLSNVPFGAELSDVVIEATGVDVLEKKEFDPSDRTLSFSLKSGVTKGSYKYSLTPKYSNGENGAALTLTVSVIDTAAKVTVAAKGNLNQFDPLSETACLGTIKLTSVQGKAVSVSSGSELIDAVLNEEGKIVFTLKDQNIKDQTVKFNVTVTLDSGDELTALTTVKVARKAPTTKLAKSVVNVYDTSYQNIEIGRVGLSYSFGQIAKVTFTESVAYDLSYDYDADEVVVVLKDAANMKAGTSASITVKVDYVGDYGTVADGIKGLKTTTLKLAIKDVSGSVKAK